MAARRAMTIALAIATACSPFGASEPNDGGGPADASTETGSTDGAAASAACPSSALLCDDFEGRATSADLAGTRWDAAIENRTLGAISDATWLSSSHSLEVAADVERSVALGRSFAVGSSVTLDVGLRLGAGSTFVYAQLVSFVLDGAFFAVVVDQDELIAQFNDGSNTRYERTRAKIVRDTWTRVRLNVRLGRNGHVTMYADDATIFEADARTTESATGAQCTLRLGITGGVGPFGTPKAWFDDVVVF